MRWLIATVLAAGCESSDGGGVVLFEDDFSSSSYPSPNWVGDGMLDASKGVPAPSLFVSARPPLVMAVAQGARPVDLKNGVTFAFDAANVAAGADSDVNLFDVNANSPVVYAEFRPAQVRLYIMGDSAGVVPVAEDTAFHSYEVHIDGFGAATWKRDGAVQLEGQLGFVPTLGRVLLRSDQNGFFVDNIRLTSD